METITRRGTVDAGEFTAIKGVTSVLTDLQLADQQILEIVPAPSLYRGPGVTVAATGTSSPFSIVFTTRRKWVR